MASLSRFTYQDRFQQVPKGGPALKDSLRIAAANSSLLGFGLKDDAELVRVQNVTQR